VVISRRGGTQGERRIDSSVTKRRRSSRKFEDATENEMGSQLSKELSAKAMNRVGEGLLRRLKRPLERRGP